MNCYEQLSDYDQTRVTTAAELYYQQLSSPSYTSYKADIKYIIKVMIVTLLILVLTAWFIESDIPFATPSRVAIVKSYMREYQSKDVYKDGKVDCKDYAYMFKTIWDTLFIDDYNCTIIYAVIQYYNNSDVTYHLMMQVDGKLIEPCDWLNDDYTKYYWVHNSWFDNTWCSRKYRECNSELQKLKRWLVNNEY